MKLLVLIPLLLFQLNTAFQQSRVEKALNFLRDDIVAASNEVPSIVSTQVVSFTLNWHRQVTLIVKMAGPNWQRFVNLQLDALMNDLSAQDKVLFQPDVDFIKSLLK